MQRWHQVISDSKGNCEWSACFWDQVTSRTQRSPAKRSQFREMLHLTPGNSEHSSFVNRKQSGKQLCKGSRILLDALLQLIPTSCKPVMVINFKKRGYAQVSHPVSLNIRKSDYHRDIGILRTKAELRHNTFRRSIFARVQRGQSRVFRWGFALTGPDHRNEMPHRRSSIRPPANVAQWQEDKHAESRSHGDCRQQVRPRDEVQHIVWHVVFRVVLLIFPSFHPSVLIRFTLLVKKNKKNKQDSDAGRGSRPVLNFRRLRLRRNIRQKELEYRRTVPPVVPVVRLAGWNGAQFSPPITA